MPVFRVALLSALTFVACEPTDPDSNSPHQPATTPKAEPAKASKLTENKTPLTKAPATLRATPDTDLRIGDTVEVCWEAAGHQSCTLSILHASGEGDFGDVTARGCRQVVVEHTTLIELFCENSTHALLQLNASE
ncbi:hypothetical protein EA187_18690 [Lujinxingia sediminis]|uniref:Uncharacterized protein n=1 Tax=Lujinxingia sediminis TaxID=2480984 RepID=A0ABY0CNH9_9DELT|nr:hypothetical protein [Lujinxingia sediminis]RVU41500.1 hypothetical protein EA187_18690 [Lujinxingia sediminis]